MSRLRLADKIAQEFNLSPETSSQIIQVLTDEIMSEVAANGRCHLRGFGVFHAVNLKARPNNLPAARSASGSETQAQIPAASKSAHESSSLKTVLRFKASKRLSITPRA